MKDRYISDKVKEIGKSVEPILNSIYEDGFQDGSKEGKDLKIEVSRIHKLEGAGSIKAFVDIVIEDAFVIKGVRIVEGEKGLLVRMPMESGKDGKWYNTVIPLKREIRDEVERLVLEAYGS